MSCKIYKPDRSGCEKAFKAIDADGSGNLDLDELKKAFDLLGLQLSRNQIQSIVDIVDTDGDGQMSLNEFIHFVHICKNADVGDIKKILFLAADADCSNAIDQEELGYIFRKLGVNISTQQLGELMNLVSDNQDGTISYETFVALLDSLLGVK
ncbi:EF_hand domain-containing protein [Hexamita inflata]|uniref:EF hand domain-containing protein n=1 Tax=Hexamita inflata TaxID=28002 RepID=A0AA86PEZ6_9EUKA|nr:EF hand domain-containing protein [Hexamita inflata]